MCIYIYIYIYIYIWRRLISRGTGVLVKTNYLLKSKGSLEGVWKIDFKRTRIFGPLRAFETLKIELLGKQMVEIGGGDVSGRHKYEFLHLHVLCADLCMSYVQIYACVMCSAVQTVSLCFAGLALLTLRPYGVRTYLYIYIWRRLILGGTGELGKADYLHNQKGSPKRV